jgi:glutaredoxin 2
MFHLVRAPGESANISEMLPNLNDFGIEDLTVVGVHWPRVQKKHLRKMSDLKVVNLSGNGISIIDNGKQHFDHNLTDTKIYLAEITADLE